MDLPAKASRNSILVYVNALFAALIFWFVETLVKNDSQPGAALMDSVIPKDPVELWFRLLVGAVIIALVIDCQGKGRKIRQLEERLYPE